MLNVSHKHDAASGCDTATEQPKRVFSSTSLEINDRETCKHWLAVLFFSNLTS